MKLGDFLISVWEGGKSTKQKLVSGFYYQKSGFWMIWETLDKKPLRKLYLMDSERAVV